MSELTFPELPLTSLKMLNSKTLKTFKTLKIEKTLGEYEEKINRLTHCGLAYYKENMGV